MGPFLTMLIFILVLVRGLFQRIKAQNSSYNECVSDVAVLIESFKVHFF